MLNNTATVAGLILIWLTLWSLYNFWMMPRKWLTETNPGKTAIFFGLFGALAIVVSSNRQLINHGGWYGGLFLICVVGGLKYNLKNAGRAANSLFQMIWLLGIYGATNNSLEATAIIFWVTHWPIVGLKHLSWWAKILMIGFSALGGLIFAGMIKVINYPMNVLAITALHLSFYWLLRPLDRKYQMNIVN